MSRSQGVGNPSLLSRALFWFAKRALGRVPLGMRIRAFDPQYLRNAVRMDLYATRRGTVPAHLKELARQIRAQFLGRLKS